MSLILCLGWILVFFKVLVFRVMLLIYVSCECVYSGSSSPMEYCQDQDGSTSHISATSEPDSNCLYRSRGSRKIVRSLSKLLEAKRGLQTGRTGRKRRRRRKGYFSKSKRNKGAFPQGLNVGLNVCESNKGSSLSS